MIPGDGGLFVAPINVFVLIIDIAFAIVVVIMAMVYITTISGICSHFVIDPIEFIGQCNIIIREGIHWCIGSGLISISVQTVCSAIGFSAVCNEVLILRAAECSLRRTRLKFPAQ